MIQFRPPLATIARGLASLAETLEDAGRDLGRLAFAYAVVGSAHMDDTGPYVIEERVGLLREVDWLSFFHARRDDVPCLLVRLHTGGHAGADAFDDDVAAMRLLHHPAWLAPRRHGRLGGVPYVELDRADGPTLATLLGGTVGQKGIPAVVVVRIVRSIAVLLDELASAVVPGAPSPHVASDTLVIGAEGRVRLVPPFRAIMRAYFPSHTGYAEADEAWTSDTMLREPDRMFDIGLLLSMLVCGLPSTARVRVLATHDATVIPRTLAALDGPNPEVRLVAPLVRRCLPGASDRFLDLADLVRALGDTS